MDEKVFFKIRIYFTVIVTVAVWTVLVWSYYHGGVPGHHILQRKDLPEFSNWWGGLLVPVLTWFLLYRVQKRVGNNRVENAQSPTFPVIILYAFIAALIFGILLSVFFTFGYTEIPFYMIIGLLLLALFLPIYRAECFLGFVIGMIYTFGGVLPIGIISILTFFGALLYLLIRPGVFFIITGIVKMTSSNKHPKSKA